MFDLADVSHGEGWSHTVEACRDPDCHCSGATHEKFKGEYRGMVVKVTRHAGARWSAWVEGFRPVFNVSGREMCAYVDRCARVYNQR